MKQTPRHACWGVRRCGLPLRAVGGGGVQSFRWASERALFSRCGVWWWWSWCWCTGRAKLPVPKDLRRCRRWTNDRPSLRLLQGRQHEGRKYREYLLAGREIGARNEGRSTNTGGQSSSLRSMTVSIEAYHVRKHG